MFICEIIIVLYESRAQRNLKITYNDKLPHYRDFFTNAQISITTTEQIYKRTHFKPAVKLSYFLVISKKIIVAYIT